MMRRAAVGLLLLTLGCARLADNFRTVDDGSFYRSGQMPASRLARIIRKHNIRAVINLRGNQPGEEWYREEKAACDALGVAYMDLGWSMRRLPSPESLAQFIAWCSESDRPTLVHCQAGIHRAGVASACYVLLEGGSLDSAREELGLFFFDAPIGQVLDLYEGSPVPFREWVLTVYPELYGEFSGQTAHIVSETAP
ncbi:MAG TPA: hypothetical protein HPP77_00960 [Candidatus Hydrogenedentes bacterium]|nr:hypothetical protein [Candidatus Hydrogenedentota bacterium]HIJ74838.1 hypothetical protein [Candidatus Hydrogenedentota bacterium]